MPTIQHLTPQTAHAFAKFAFKAHLQKYLLQPENKPDLLKLGAYVGEAPAGLIFAERTGTKDFPNNWRIINFYVDEKFRRQGVGTALITRLKEELKSCNCEEVSFGLVTSQTSVAQLEALLTKHGFCEFELLTNVYKFKPCVINQQSPFVKRAFASTQKFNDKVSILLKNQLDMALLRTVELKEGIDYPDILSPFKNEFNLEEAFHFFAVSPIDGIVGWGTTFFRHNGHIILYRSFFVKEEYRHEGVGVGIFNHCLKYHIENYYDWYFVFAVAEDNPRTDKLLRRYTGEAFDWERHEVKTSCSF
jgi:GNAT superfamily N-acetyltransferase